MCLLILAMILLAFLINTNLQITLFVIGIAGNCN